MEERTKDWKDWIAEGWAALRDGWDWWMGLSDAYAWQEIGAYLIPALLFVIIGMFWGIRRMWQSH